MYTKLNIEPQIAVDTHVHRVSKRLNLANEKDDELNNLIGKINLVQMNYQKEASKGEEADESKMEQYGKEFEEAYRAVMLNGNMVKFEAAKTAVDDMMNEIMGILALCVDGQDPETCTPAEEHHCNGSECKRDEEHKVLTEGEIKHILRC